MVTTISVAIIDIHCTASKNCTNNNNNDDRRSRNDGGNNGNHEAASAPKHRCLCKRPPRDNIGWVCHSLPMDGAPWV